MNKRVIAAVSAGVLALMGVVVLVVWAKGANDRAYDGADLVKVVRVTKSVAADTKAEDLAGSTEVAELPSTAIPKGAVTDLAQVSGLSTTTALETGEILLKSRLAGPGGNRKGEIEVPKGYQEISISLDPQRTVGSSLSAGDRVGVFASFDSGATGSVNKTDLVRHNVLVTKVAGTANVKDGSLTGLMITLAVKTKDAEKIVFAAEFGKIWLSAQNVDTDKTGEVVITVKDLVK